MYDCAKRVLNEALEQAGFHYHVHPLFNGWQWTVDELPFGDIIIHDFSYGHERQCYETMGFPWDDEDVTGYLSLDDLMGLLKGAVKDEA